MTKTLEVFANREKQGGGVTLEFRGFRVICAFEREMELGIVHFIGTSYQDPILIGEVP